MRLVLATHNAHKVGELQSILAGRLSGVELTGYDGPEPVEDGSTFEANALIKARAAFVHTGVTALADDSGICIDALGGAPGILSARYSGTRLDADNVDRVLKELAGTDDRSAQFVCSAVCVGEGFELVASGVWPGTVLRAPAGGNGFGYDPIFQPDGCRVSAAELSPAEKNAISHRAIAFGRLAELLSSRLARAGTITTG
ncbi:MAG: RdgB/HAM1 family non-canonical purine NTP pyrophosphatase [Microbacteriaceae bacterium]